MMFPIGIDKKIDDFFLPIAEFISDIVFFKVIFWGYQIPVVILTLVLAAIFFTIYFRFINIRGFGLALRITNGDYTPKKTKGEVSHFQALATAISGTVGIGNIGGIPIAIAMGGPGAVFWMIVAGFLGMSTKFTECALATRFRKTNPDGSVSGGPMYYIRQAFEMKGFNKTGKTLGFVYALGIVLAGLGIGNMFQSNQAYTQFVVMTGGDTSFFVDKAWLFGLIFASFVFAVIVGGIKSIASVADKIVPFMAGFYLLAAVLIISLNYSYIIPSIELIFEKAFNPDAAFGGAIGVMLIGFQRAVFSNEAGLGSAAIAHSAVQTNEPVTEGFVAILGPFIDTIIIQTITALVVITSLLAFPGFTGSELQGIEMTSAAFTTHFAYAPYIISFAGLLFAFSTAIAWSYYGVKGWTYIFGEGKKRVLLFNTIFTLFFALGCVVNLDSIMSISDSLLYLIAIPNIIGMIMLVSYLKKDAKSYMQRIKSGEIKKQK